MSFPRICAGLLAIACAASAQSIELKGIVKDASGAPVAGAWVRLESTGYQALSGADGSFTLNGSSTALLPAPRSAQGGMLMAHAGGHMAWFRSPGNTHATLWRIDGRGLVVTGLPDVDAVRAAPAPKAAAGFKDVLSAGKSGYLTYRTMATNPAATGLEVRLLASAGAIKDADGNEYQTVKLGNQVWMAEHLRTTRYVDGTAIPRVQDKTGWANRATPAFCSYNGMADADSLKRFGLLYNWHAVNTKKLAPEGWRVPSGADWMALQNWLIANGYNFDGTTSGNKVGKAMSGMTDWVASTKAGATGNDQSKNNKSGLGGVPTGFRDQGGNFTSMGSRCIMHATDTKENTFGYFADLDAGSETLRYSDDWMSMGFSIRLIKTP